MLCKTQKTKAKAQSPKPNSTLNSTLNSQLNSILNYSSTLVKPFTLHSI